MKSIKLAMMRVLAEDKDVNIPQLKNYLGMTPTLSVEAEELSENTFLIKLEHPDAVDGVPECINKLEGKDLFFDYYITVKIHTRRATRDEPAEFDSEIDEEDISINTDTTEAAFTPEELTQLTAFFELDRLDALQRGFFSELEERITDYKCESYDGEDYGGYDDRDDDDR